MGVRGVYIIYVCMLMGEGREGLVGRMYSSMCNTTAGLEYRNFKNGLFGNIYIMSLKHVCIG